MTPLAFTSVAEFAAAIPNDGFAALTNDRQWIHVDVERAARESPFGTTIAHGCLTLSLLAPMIASCVSNPPAKLAINYGFDRVRFITPVPVGSQIRGRFTPVTVKWLDGAVGVGWDVEIQLRGIVRPVFAARWLSRFVDPQ